MSAQQDIQIARCQAAMLDVLLSVESGSSQIPAELLSRMRTLAVPGPPRESPSRRRDRSASQSPRRRRPPPVSVSPPARTRPDPDEPLPEHIGRLYDDAAKRRARAAKRVSDAQKQELSRYSFQPATGRSRADDDTDKAPFWERYGGMKGTEHHRTRLKRCNLLADTPPDELDDIVACTFHPQISLASRAMEHGRIAPFWQRCGGMQASVQRQRRLQELRDRADQELLTECTHAPALNHHRTPRRRKRRRTNPLRSLFRSLLSEQGGVDRKELIAVLHRHSDPAALLGVPASAGDTPAAFWVEALAQRWEGEVPAAIGWDELVSDVHGTVAGVSKADQVAQHLHDAFTRIDRKRAGVVSRAALGAAVVEDRGVRKLLRAAGCSPRGMIGAISGGGAAGDLLAFADYCAELRGCRSLRRESVQSCDSGSDSDTEEQQQQPAADGADFRRVHSAELSCSVSVSEGSGLTREGL
eukprot:TRINITY_DN31106_c0_g1_i1.p1 TRINITY_DN31106_c0_g1~~TRINITY_DN31106_c0_g1_i1.p1  ORF type:complete len:471 (+),score=110.17 TRINITY_DN31106_c0_g1_i1:80-1492(+)